MSTHLRPPPEFSETEYPAQSWADWKQRFTIYAAASCLNEKDDAAQVAIFLHIVGPVGIKVYNNFELADTADLSDIIAMFDEYYKPYKNQTHLSYLFFTYKQVQGQTADQYIAELRTKARECEFGDMTDRLVRDIAICGIIDKTLRQKLLALPNPTLSEVVSLCRAVEQSQLQTNKMSTSLSLNTESSVMAVSKKSTGKRPEFIKKREVNSKPNFKTWRNQDQRTMNSNCSKCGTKHQPRNCPAFGKTCMRCGGKNHFKLVCNRVKISEITDNFDNLKLDDFNNYFVGALGINEVKDWEVTLKLNNIDMNFKIDSGSDINVVPEKLLMTLKDSPMVETLKVSARAYSGHNIPIIGRTKVIISYKEKSLPTDIYVTSLDGCPLINGKLAIDLGLIERLYSVETKLNNDIAAQEVLNKFPDIFDGKLGELKNTYKLQVDPTVVPTVTPTRKIPIALMKPLRMELDRMETEGVIAPVTVPTDWVNALLPIQKNGKFRIVLDPRPLNVALKREHYPIPTLDVIIGHLKNCKLFTVLDARDAFWQMKLDFDSSQLCTFGTPFGRYKFLRVPFGISVAPEFQQRTMDNICMNLDGTTAFFDDVIVGGKDLVEHNERLEKFLIRAREAGLKLKSEKTQLAQSKVTFIGHVISGEGIQPAHKNVSAICALKYPSTKKELLRFLGMVSFLGKFIPNLSDKAMYLRTLLKHQGPWNWSERAANDFDLLKKCVKKAPMLMHFDPDLPLKLSVDASLYGLGAVIMQNNKPLEFASATLSSTQRRYAQIEKELLAVAYGCVKFHYFTYGRAVEVETDHKPLLAIIKKPMDAISPRLQRLVLKLQKYNILLKYIPGKELFIADTLSRCPTPDALTTDVDDDNLQVHTLALQKPLSKTHEIIRLEVEKDPVCQQLLQYLEMGWPERIYKISPDLKIYHQYRHELYQVDGLIYRAERILVPTTLRKKMLERIHESHQGIVASKMRAREHLFWPGMTKDIEDLIAGCHICQKFRASNTKEPLMSFAPPETPWDRIAADIFYLNNVAYLLIVDYYSKFAELVALGSCTKAYAVINALKAIFCTHGTPRCLMSDNGPPFDSYEVRNFAEQWNFNIMTSSPTYPQSNGQVERTIRTIKTQLLKCYETSNDPYLVLLNYNSTPHDMLPAPSVLLMARKLRTTLPGHDKNYETIQKNPIMKKILLDRQNRQAFYYNKDAKPLKPLSVDTPVYYQTKENKWAPAIITEKTNYPRSYKIYTQGGSTLRRNRRHLRIRTNLVPFPNTEKECYNYIPPVNPKPILTPDLKLTPKPSNSTEMRMNSPVAMSQQIPNDTSNEEVKKPMVTRSGRVINTPARYRS